MALRINYMIIRFDCSSLTLRSGQSHSSNYFGLTEKEFTDTYNYKKKNDGSSSATMAIWGDYEPDSLSASPTTLYFDYNDSEVKTSIISGLSKDIASIQTYLAPWIYRMSSVNGYDELLIGMLENNPSTNSRRFVVSVIDQGNIVEVLIIQNGKP